MTEPGAVNHVRQSAATSESTGGSHNSYDNFGIFSVLRSIQTSESFFTSVCEQFSDLILLPAKRSLSWRSAGDFAVTLCNLDAASSRQAPGKAAKAASETVQSIGAKAQNIGTQASLMKDNLGNLKVGHVS